MAGGIKGIIVKIGGDTTELGRSLTAVSKQTTQLQRELKGVNTLLKYDPKNVTLLKQKQDLLKTSIEQTKKKLADLIEVQKKVDSGEIKMTTSEYQNLQREIASTKGKLQQLTEEQSKFGSVGAQQIAAVGEKVKSVGDGMQSVGQKLMPVTVAIGGIGAAAIKTTADFDSSMSNVSAISGATGKDLQALRDKAREMGAQTKFSASESADAMSYMAMAGWKTEDMLNGISGVMDLAAASGEDLATTSDILTDGLTAFGLSAQDSGRMADVMAAASSNANTNVSLLGESYKYCASTAGAMGYSLEDVTESLGLMANAGVKGSQAGTSLKTAMINLAKPTSQMQAVMDKYHISITNTDGSMKSWNEVVDMLRTNLGGLSEAEQTSAAATIFGKESVAGMLSVINAAPADVEKLNSAIKNSTGTAKEMADTMNDNLTGQLTILKSQLEELALSFGELLMPAIRNIVTAIQGFVDKLNGMSDSQRQVIVTIALVIAAIAPLLIVVGKVVSTVGQVMTLAPKIVNMANTIGSGLKALWGILAANPILLVVAAIAALVAGLVFAYNHCETFRNIVDTAFNAIKTTVTNVVTTVVGFFTQTIPSAFNSLKTAVSPVLDAIKSAFETAFNAIANVVTVAVNVIKNILMIQFAAALYVVVPLINMLLTVFTTVFNSIESVVTSAMNAVKNTISTIFNSIKSIVTSALNSIKSVVTSAWNAIKSVTTSVWNSIKSAVSTPLNAVKSTVSSIVNSIKSTVTSAWNAIKSTTTSVWNSIKSAITTPINAAKSAFTSAVNTMRNALKFSWSLPPLKLPHISVTGGEAPFGIGGKGSLPKFNISWYKDGAIFKKPTIFDTPYGFKGVGEAGAEAVAPIELLQKYVSDAIIDRNQAVEKKLDTVISMMAAYYPDALQIMNRPITVGVSDIDNALSDRNNKLVRGW